MARSFNGTTDQIATAAWNMTAIMSQSIWLNATSTTPAYTGISVQDSTPNSQFGFYVKSTGKFAYYVRDSGGGQDFVDPGSATIVLSAWTHLAMTYSAANGLKTYVNGVSDGTVAATGNTVWLANNPVAVGIGYDTGTAGRNFAGSLADATRWSVELTAAEITALAAGARPGSIRPASLLLWLPLTGVSSPEPDLSSFARNGTLTGTTNASGPPVMQFTPRWPQFLAPAVAPSFNPAWAKGKNIVIEGVAT